MPMNFRQPAAAAALSQPDPIFFSFDFGQSFA
jgi:hypothetical protein